MAENNPGGTETSPRNSSRAGIPGWPTAHHARLDSTNLEAKRLVAVGDTRKRLILADTQTRGQCRRDRLWESAPGKGVWATFVLPVSVPPPLLPQSAIVLAVAVREGVLDATGIALTIKWPNDLLGNGKKCCGLLVETASEALSGVATPLILGVGINCGHARADFPEHLRDSATSLSLLAEGRTLRRENILRLVARGIDRWFAVWQERGFAPVRDAWRAHSGTLGRPVMLPEGYGYPSGTAEDLDASGALVVRADDGTLLTVDSGEILLRPPGM